MSKFELKKDVNPKGVVSYRTPEKSGMSRVELGKATQAQLAQLAKLKHPSVVESKAVK